MPNSSAAGRRRVWCAALLVGSLLPIAACARSTPDAAPAPRRVLSPASYRPLDGLLESPDLQRLVDLQIDRDGGALAAALRDPDARVRARAAFALGSVQDTLQVPALIPLLEDGDARVRADAAFALGQAGTAAGAGALLRALLSETDTTVVVVMLDALGRVGGEAELWGLADAEIVRTRDGPRPVAAALALAFARFGMRGLHDQKSAEWVIEALSAQALEVRQNAAYYFARSREPQSWAHLHRQLVRALGGYGFHDRAAMHLLTGLARLDDEDDIAGFATWLTDSPDWAIRVSAARALGQHTEYPEARVALTAALRDRSHHVRVAAAAGLANAQLTASEADTLIARAPAFIAEPVVLGSLVSAIARAGHDEWVLAHWRGLSDARARRTVVGALAPIPGRAAFASLERAASDADSTVASAAIDALANRRTLDLPDDADDARYYAIFANALRTRDLAIASAAATALADSVFEPLGAGPALQSVFLQLRAPHDSESMVEIIRALGALNDSSAVPLLREARAGTWPALRTAAAAALARIAGEPAAMPNGDPPPTVMMQWDWLADWGDAPRLRLETERGVVVLELSPEQAPLTVQTVLTLANDGRYNDVPFHRVVPNFVIQGGDVERGDGRGGPGFAIRSEFTRVPFLRGSVGVASSGKDTEGSQYFVTHSMQPHLDGRYTSFGRVIEGLDVIDAILQDDRVLRATAEPGSNPAGT